MFLIPQDYNPQIRPEILLAVAGGQQYNIQASELTALAEMESYLASRYDVAKIFVDVSEWNATTQYAKGAVVWQEGPVSQVVFTAFEPSQGISPLAPGTQWIPTDPRNPLLRTYLVDMTIYHVQAASPARDFPEHRLLRYEAAINWLKKVNAGQLTPALPLLPDDAQGQPTDGVLRLGHRPKLSHDR